MKKNKLLLTAFTSSMILSGCSIFSSKDICSDNCISIEDNKFAIYEKNKFLKFYEGEIDENGLYDKLGVFYFSNGSYLKALSEKGLIKSGEYLYNKNGSLYSLSFNDEAIDPLFIQTYKFKNDVIFKKINSEFSYQGNFKNLSPNGNGVLYKDDLIFDGDFKENNFFGKIENNFQTKSFNYEPSDNSIKFEFKNGIKRNLIQGVLNGERLKGTETILVNDKELLSYSGEWKLNNNPFSFYSYEFENLNKNGIFKIFKNKENKNYTSGNFVNNKKDGYFEIFKNNQLTGFEYYKNNEKLYYIPFYLDVENQLVNKNKCEYHFPETINLWHPFKFNYCSKGIYSIDFIDKENKDFLLNMVYDVNKEKIIKLTVLKEDFKYHFINFKQESNLSINSYILKGKAKIYQFINGKYKLINTSNVNLTSKK